MDKVGRGLDTRPPRVGRPDRHPPPPARARARPGRRAAQPPAGRAALRHRAGRRRRGGPPVAARSARSATVVGEVGPRRRRRRRRRGPPPGAGAPIAGAAGHRHGMTFGRGRVEPTPWRRGKSLNGKPEVRAAGGLDVARRRGHRPRQRAARRHRGGASSTGRATTTGRSPRASSTRARPPRQAALREVEEETGLVCELGDEVAAARYIDGKGRRKEVRYWVMHVVEVRALGGRRRGRPPAVGHRRRRSVVAHLRSRPGAARRVRGHVHPPSTLLKPQVRGGGRPHLGQRSGPVHLWFTLGPSGRSPALPTVAPRTTHAAYESAR